MHELGGGEAVVELDEVQVLGTDSGLLVGDRRCVAGEGVDVGEDLAGLLVRVGGEHRRRDLHRATLLLERERAQLRLADHDRCRTAVAVGRAHGPRVRVGDHHVVHDLVEREALRVGRERVEHRVGVVLLADLREGLEAHLAVLVAVLHADLGEGDITIDASKGTRKCYIYADEFNTFTTKAVQFNYGPVEEDSTVNKVYYFGGKTCIMDVQLLIKDKAYRMMRNKRYSRDFTASGMKIHALQKAPALVCLFALQW